MKRKSSRKRRYASALRDDQVTATRARILDGLLAAGGQAISIPALAKKTKVSVPTIYRHFPTRSALLAATVEHVDKMVAQETAGAIDVEDHAAWIRAFFETRERAAEKLGSLADGALTWEIRKTVTVPRRRAFMDALIMRWAPELEEPQRTWLSDILVVLISSTTASAFRSYVGCGAKDGADRMIWLFDALKIHAQDRSKRRRR